MHSIFISDVSENRPMLEDTSTASIVEEFCQPFGKLPNSSMIDLYSGYD